VLDRLPDFERLLSALDAAGVRYVLIGGLAMIAQGSSYQTDDADLAFARDRANVASLSEALKPFDPRPVDFPRELPFVWDGQTLHNSSVLTLETTIGRIDLLGEPAGIDSFDGLFERSTTVDLFGHSVKVASIDDLIAMKQAAGREKDRLHILELEALRGLSG
jgi:predicted nucleotidyltransferase